MSLVGTIGHLPILRLHGDGAILDGGEEGEVLLAHHPRSASLTVGDELEVFINRDAEEGLVASTKLPVAVVGECAYLPVTSVTQVGAFLDWGLEKELLVPFSEQRIPLQEGRSYVVYLYLDDHSDRVAASTRLSDYLSEEGEGFRPLQRVELLICSRSDMGYKAIINGTHLGLLYQDELHQQIAIGDRRVGYIKTIRDDLRLDLTLHPPGQWGRDELAQQILAQLHQDGGSSSLTDRSTPAQIAARYGVSKAVYKKALGNLYKQQLIVIERDQITLSDRGNTQAYRSPLQPAPPRRAAQPTKSRSTPPGGSKQGGGNRGPQG